MVLRLTSAQPCENGNDITRRIALCLSPVRFHPGAYGRIDPVLADSVDEPYAFQHLANRRVDAGQPQFGVPASQLIVQVGQRVGGLQIQVRVGLEI